MEENTESHSLLTDAHRRVRGRNLHERFRNGIPGENCWQRLFRLLREN